MTSSRIIILLPTLLTLFSISSFSTKKPNVIIFLADDLGYGDVGFHGSDIQTPNIDRLAREGSQLEAFYSCPVCTPTRAGLMTGRYPIRYGLMRAVIPPQRDYGLDLSEETMADVFAKAGYEHRGIFGKWHLGHRQKKWGPTKRGFTDFIGHYNGAIDYFTHERDGERDWHRNDVPFQQEGYSTDLIGESAAAFLKRIPKSDPYFLYVPFNAPHSPLQAKKEDLAKYDHREGRPRIHAAMVDSMDQAMGKILEAAEERGDLDDTFVLFFSDNGGVTNVGSNGELKGAKASVYQGGIRVAAAAMWKNGGIVGGKRIRERMGYIDILPTIRNMIGITDPPKKPLDGIDVLEAMRGKTQLEDRLWFSYIDQAPDQIERLAVNTNFWKLVIHRSAADAKERIEPTLELFEIGNDPYEKLDIAKWNPESVKKRAGRIAEAKTDLSAAIEEFLSLRIDDQIIRFRVGAGTTPAIPDWSPTR
ncbi:MAG: arylsulfatase [Opitutaceae bacterium]|nr:arylsulfatase [Opitutaceae bacterium]